MSKKNRKTVCHFSCGAASAVATKIVLDQHSGRGEIVIIYCDTGSEHPDNQRFLKDCEDWFGQEVIQIRSNKYSNIYDVFEDQRFLSSPYGAPCTGLLKRRPALSYIKAGDDEVFGYTLDEQNRLARWKAQNPDRRIFCPLIERSLTKEDCLGILEKHGIELPEMYKLGFRNNNCIGCVKARDSINYWKRVRKHFPEQFLRTAKLERKFNITLNRVSRNGKRVKVFLDELEPGDPKGEDINIQCGLFCMAEASALEYKKAHT